MTAGKSQVPSSFIATLLMSLLFCSSSFAQGFEGYYQHADIHKNIVIFAAEGDLWSVPLSGGIAQRLTTHSEEEIYQIWSGNLLRVLKDVETIAEQLQQRTE